MEHRNKVNVKKKPVLWFALLLLILTIPQFLSAQINPRVRDTANKQLPRRDTIIKKITDTFNLRMSKDTLSAPVTYHADDSVILMVPEKKMYLYGKKTEVTYQDNNLTAPIIEYDQQTSLVKAMLKKDTNGKVIAYPEFKQADFSSKSDTIIFNMKTRRGLTKGTYTQQGEMYVYGEKIKKASEDVFYALNTRFTTCNLDTPHFAFVSKQVKFINKKWAFTGPVHPEFEAVPVPIVLPFGIFPLKTGRRSGLLSPSFNSNSAYGLSIERLGYYRIINDNIDVQLYGTGYSYGGWGIQLVPRYFKRYKSQGNMMVSLNSNKTLDRPALKTFAVNWNHNMDSRARPGVNFTAMVNFSSTRHNELVPNSPRQNFNNTTTSSIQYSKTWKNKPFNLSLNASHSQNNQLRRIDFDLPNVTFSMSTVYPLRKKQSVGEPKWYENFGIGLTTSARNSSFFYDTMSRTFTNIYDNHRWGIDHSVPITLALPSLGPIQITPGVSYSERWFQQRLKKEYNPFTNKMDTIEMSKGFYTARNMTFSLGMATRIFGMFGFSKKSKIQAIRHQITPNLAFNYVPAMNSKSVYNLKQPGGNVVATSLYEGAVFGPFSNNRAAGFSFSVDNNIAMKVRSRKDTSNGGIKKISVIDNLGFNTFYNFLADSFKLADINASGSSNLFERLSVNYSGTFSPYQKATDGRRLDKLVWAKRPLSLGYLSRASLSMSTSMRGGDKKVNNDKGWGQRQDIINAQRNSMSDYQAEAAYIQNNPGEFVDFNIPWQLNLSYSFSYSNPVYSIGGVRSPKQTTMDATFDGSINLSPKWKIGGGGTYNISQKTLGYVNMYLSREMHCWQMSVNISPVGKWRFFSINISPKSPILRDLKINRTRSFYDL